MKVNENYVQTLPEVKNKYGVELLEGEKVLFTAKLSIWGDDKDQPLGGRSVFTLTNQRIVVDNGAGIWTIALKEEISAIAKITKGRWILKTTHFNVDLYEPMTYNYGKNQLKGFHFYFTKSDEAKFEKIIENLV